jgi:hypothetical protein
VLEAEGEELVWKGGGIINKASGGGYSLNFTFQ